MRRPSEIARDAEKAAGLPEGIISDQHFRTYDVSLARHVAYYVARKETRWSCAQIAAAIGARDHKAVLHGFNRVSIALAQGDPEVMNLVNAVAPDLEVR